MLQSLYIQNYALIDELDIHFDQGFSVITGETGAGKSIILGAIGLLLGQRADIKSIKNGASKCVVEAHFDIKAYQLETFFDENGLEFDAGECILRRELLASGKSRAFINDSPASLTLMKELGERLIDVHSQHQNLLINNEGFQLNVLDVLAHNSKELSVYKTAYSAYKKTIAELDKLTEEAARSRADEEYIRFQLEELENARLREGEQEELEKEVDMLSNAEEIKAGLYKVEQRFVGDGDTLLSVLKENVNILHSLQKVYAPSGELSERLESCFIELKDISQEISRHQERMEYNPEQLERATNKLNLIYSLQQKHRVSTEAALLELLDDYRLKLERISSSDERISILTKQKEAEYAEVKRLAEALTATRARAAQMLQEQMTQRLIPLGMPNVRFNAQLTNRKEPDSSGADIISFLFSANKNGQLQPISSVASGGEIARVMLSLKALISGETQLPTIIFDEIDTGVSGEIAAKMAGIMQEMGHHIQVISITHLPQIAAKGVKHYKVYKEDDETTTSSNICLLDEENRIKEIAHMLSGATLTEAAINNAKELLRN